MASIVEGSFASPSADAQNAYFISGESPLTRFFNGLNPWNIALSIVLGLVVYDQCMTLVH